MGKKQVWFYVELDPQLDRIVYCEEILPREQDNDIHFSAEMVMYPGGKIIYQVRVYAHDERSAARYAKRAVLELTGKVV